jgi:hypothetical protein
VVKHQVHEVHTVHQVSLKKWLPQPVFKKESGVLGGLHGLSVKTTNVCTKVPVLTNTKENHGQLLDKCGETFSGIENVREPQGRIEPAKMEGR